MSQIFFNLIPEAVFWLVCLVVSAVVVKSTGLYKKPLNTAKSSIMNMSKKVAEYASAKKDKKNLLSEAKSMSSILKDAKKAHDALSVHCYDNRMDKDSADTLKTIDLATELLHKLSKGVFNSDKEYERTLKSLVKETDKAVKQIKAITG